jgi:hypothetical protein
MKKNFFLELRLLYRGEKGRKMSGGESEGKRKREENGREKREVGRKGVKGRERQLVKIIR